MLLLRKSKTLSFRFMARCLDRTLVRVKNYLCSGVSK